MNTNDWFLQSFIEMVNSSNNISYGLTIIIHGSIVSGECVSGKIYFEEFGKEMASLVEKEEMKTTFRNHYRKIGETIYKKKKL